MSGYNISLDRTKHDVLNMILDNIKSGSSVLEFGCANGRMTKYMSQELGCTVDIIEYDEELFQIAKEYAAYGICGDILQFEWKKQLEGKKYDYIIFADVLEHLNDPKKVLTECKTLLKENGMIWISVPNIAHNDIIVSLTDNQFNYTETGLLDCTHIHFFTDKSAKKMFEEAGYHVVYEDASYKQMFCTELLLLEDFAWKDSYAEMLNKAEGEVYQWLFAISCSKKECLPVEKFTHYNREKSFYERRIYVNDGTGYKEYSVNREEIRKKKIKIEIELNGDIDMVWVQPAFKKFFVIDNLEILVDGKKALYCQFDGERTGDRYIVTNTKGSIYIDSLKGKQRVEIRGSISFDMSDVMQLKSKETEIKTLKNRIKQEKNDKKLFKEEVQRLNNVIVKVNEERGDLVTEVQRLNDVIVLVNEDKKNCTEEIQRLNGVITQVSTERRDLVAEVQRLNDVIAQVSTERGDLVAEVQRLNDVITQVCNERGDLVAEVQRLNDVITEMNKKRR